MKNAARAAAHWVCSPWLLSFQIVAPRWGGVSHGWDWRKKDAASSAMNFIPPRSGEGGRERSKRPGGRNPNAGDFPPPRSLRPPPSPKGEGVLQKETRREIPAPL